MLKFLKKSEVRKIPLQLWTVLHNSSVINACASGHQHAGPLTQHPIHLEFSRQPVSWVGTAILVSLEPLLFQASQMRWLVTYCNARGCCH
jgi:hypothetical protein